MPGCRWCLAGTAAAISARNGPARRRVTALRSRSPRGWGCGAGRGHGSCNGRRWRLQLHPLELEARALFARRRGSRIGGRRRCVHGRRFVYSRNTLFPFGTGRVISDFARHRSLRNRRFGVKHHVGIVSVSLRRTIYGHWHWLFRLVPGLLAFHSLHVGRHLFCFGPFVGLFNSNLSVSFCSHFALVAVNCICVCCVVVRILRDVVVIVLCSGVFLRIIAVAVAVAVAVAFVGTLATIFILLL